MKYTARLTTLLIATSLFLADTLAAQGSAETNLMTNGSFESWAHYATEGLPGLLKAGGAYENAKNPLIPVRWSWRLAGTTLLARSADAHGGKAALAMTGDGGDVRWSSLEVVPGATYSVGIWAKGKGKVVVTLSGQAPEGAQVLGEAAGEVKGEWQLIEQKVKIPGHIRVIDFAASIYPSDKTNALVVDDAHISAPLDFAYDADAVLTQKLIADADTILLADFDKDDASIKLIGKSHYINEGRFGRALRVESPDSAMIPLKLNQIPEEGTLEFYLSPDQVGQLDWKEKGLRDTPQQHFLSVDNASGALAYFRAGSDTTLGFAWNTDPWKNGADTRRNNWVFGPNEVSLRRMRKGQWMHVAVTWDASAMRMYVDGVLYGRKTEGPLKWKSLPTSLSIGSGMYGHLTWTGAVDDVRVSKIKRFGPFLPKGATAKPLTPAPAPILSAAPARPFLTQEQLATERAKLLQSLPPTQAGLFETKPDANGDFVFEAERAKPLVSDGKFVVLADKPAAGLTTVQVGESGSGRLLGDPVNGGACWKLDAIPSGNYHIGLLYESQDTRHGSVIESPQAYKRIHLFLNGRVIQPGSTSDPVQVAPGKWFTEFRPLAAEALKPGDEIAVVIGGGQDAIIARLLLHTTAPVIGAGRAPLHFGDDFWQNVDTVLRVNTLCYFVNEKGQRLPGRNMWHGQEQLADSPASFLRGADEKAIAHCLVANPLPVAVTVDFDCTVKGYYGQIAGRLAQSITLQAHERRTLSIPFTVTEDDHAYSIKSSVKGAAADITRQLGWPAMDTISLFPGYRQSVAWRDPLNTSHAKRIVFKEPLKTPHHTLSLNGTWERAFIYKLVPDVVPPADAKWEAAAVPIPISQALAQEPQRQFGAYYRRSFEMPDDKTPRSYRLVIKKAGAEAAAYVNGTQVGLLRGSNTPLVVDITSALRPGKNEILITVRDLLAVMNQEYVNPAAPVASPQYLDAAAGFESLARLLLGDVDIEASPAVAAEDLLVTTSFRKKAFSAAFSVSNHSAKKTRAIVKATVQDARKVVLDLGQKEVEVGVNQSVPLSFNKPWADPQLWSPANPYLYVLAVEVTDAATGEKLDLARQRFGFCETWIDNASIMLNGGPIKPKALTTPHPWGADLDYTMSRGAPIPDWMDENGFLASAGLAGVANSSSKHNVDRDVFWESARANVLAGAKRLQNHPCIIAWDLSNEWYGFLSYSGKDPLLGAKRLRSLTEVLEKQDPNRWTFYNGDEDLSELHYAFSGHYLSPYKGDYRMDNHRAYAPDRFFFRKLDHTFKVGEHVIVSPARGISVEWGKKLLMNTEHLWKVGWMNPPGPTEFIGEEDILSAAVDHYSGPAAWSYKQNLDGHRDLNCAVVAFYGGTCPSRRGWMLQQFIMPEMVHHAYAGSTISRDYSLHSDLFVPAKVKFIWKLLAPDGAVVARGENAQQMTSGDLKRGTLNFKAPAVNKRTTFTLDMQMQSNGSVVYAEQRDIDVDVRQTRLSVPSSSPDYEKPQTGVSVSRTALFDPSGKTSALLKGSVPIADLAKIEGLTIQQGPVGDSTGLSLRAVIIGEDALTEANAAEVARLEKFVEDGGRVVILAQQVTPQGLPVVTKIEPKEWSSQVFVQMGDHPILKGITDWDLHFWAPARVTGRGAYAKPDSGPFTALANSGSTIGMEWVQLMECYRGKGSYLLCQLPLIAAAEHEPMAREILSRLIHYATSEKSPLTPAKTMKVLTAIGSPVDKRLRDIGVAIETIADAKPLLADDVGMIDATHPDAALAAAKWKDALSAGATVIVSGAVPADAAWLSSLAGQQAQIIVQPYRMWDGRGYRNGRSPLTAGLTHLDLFFKTYDETEGPSPQSEDTRLLIEPLGEYSAHLPGARELVFPGLLLEQVVGKGKLVIDQRRWTTTHEKLVKPASRQVTTLALGLGLNIAPAVPTRELPPNVTYQPIDLTIWANRSFTDQVQDDGKDGWPDQGPQCDVRGFPTGKPYFQGVPFVIGTGAKSVIALRNPARPGAADFPTEVSIPIGTKTEGFYFIHGSAYTGQTELGSYQVQYADGTTLKVPLKSGVNLWDWIEKNVGFGQEKGTRSIVAWTGSNDTFDSISLYRMLWVNLKPDVVVTDVRITTSGKSSLMLAGLTAVIAKGQQDTTPAQIAQARQALSDAMKAIEEKKPDQAEKLLHTALQSDPSLTAARQALADLHERQGNEAAALQTYQAWATARATTPLPYNRIGEILEKRKDYPGALAAYTQSLVVEWNQPPIIEAKSRVQKIVLEKK